jgi:GH24 family phage-related lysozyme (muramidase)
VGVQGGYTIPSTVTTIGDFAFDLSRLTDVTIPDGVASIGNVSFYFTALTSVTIPESVASIAPYAFGDSLELAAINVDPNNLAYSSLNGILFDKHQTTLIQYPGGLDGSYTVPDGVTTIALGAFFADFRLTNVTIPSSITNIQQQAFAACGQLTNITVSAQNVVYSDINGVLFDKNQDTLIQYPAGSSGDYAIPNGVTTIGYGAFYSDTNLTSVTIPPTVTTLNSAAFENCSNLTTLMFQGNAPSADSTVFGGDDGATICYLAGTAGWTSPFFGLPASICN